MLSLQCQFGWNGLFSLRHVLKQCVKYCAAQVMSSLAHVWCTHGCRKSKQDAVPTVAYSEGYSTLSYYLASACDQIYLHPN